MRTSRWFLALVSAMLALGACVHVGSSGSGAGRALSDDTVLRHASAAPLDVVRARVLLGNDAAFRAKLEAIRGARRSVDAMYFIYSDDVSSSVLSRELLAAARRGVRVRLLVDYQRNYERLDLLTMMEKQARAGPGSLEVRFYNRPTRNMVMDAVYLTMGCGEVGSPEHATCAAAKSADIERRFAGERIDGRLASELGVSNLDIGNSGLFLAGLYARQPDVMAMAVIRGQDIDVAALKASGGTSSAGQKQQLARLGRIYWRSHFAGGLSRLAAKLQLAFAFALYGKALNPIHDTFTAYLPLERRGAAASAQDWDYMTEFLHHKLLLVDNTSLQLGGRNIEDSYHMRPNALVDKYIFMDTDLHAELRAGGEKVESAFEALWNYRRMVVCRAATPANPQRVVLHHAYFHPASALITALGRMVDGQLDCRNVTVTILTNSVETTDLSIVNLLARHSIKAFVEYAAARMDPARSARFEYYEYLKQPSAAGNSLHTKVSILGDDVIIGSANADVRSYMMDTNNGMFLRRARRFLDAYLAWVDGMTRDATLTRNQTEYFVTVPRPQVLEEDRAMFRLIMAAQRAGRWLDAAQQREAEETLVKMLDDGYALTKEILEDGREGRAKASEFDRVFKAM